MLTENDSMLLNILTNMHVFVHFIRKGKAIPLQAWTGPESSRSLRFPDFMTTAHESGKVVSLTNRPPLPLGNIPGTSVRG